MGIVWRKKIREENKNIQPNGSNCYQSYSTKNNLASLPYSMCSAHRLQVVLRIPVRVEYDDLNENAALGLKKTHQRPLVCRAGILQISKYQPLKLIFYEITFSLNEDFHLDDEISYYTNRVGCSQVDS